MTLICFASQKGSPGTTATALAVAAALKVSDGRRKLLVEADATGGTLAIRYRLPVEPGLLTLAAAVRGGLEPEGVWRHAQELPGGLSVLVCPDGSDQVHAAMAASGALLGRYLDDMRDVDVICDVGRLAPGSPSLDFVAQASALLMVARPHAEQLQPAARKLVSLQSQVKNLGWVLVGQKPYGAAEVEATYDFPVVGLIADDPRSVASLEQGGMSKRLRRHPFVRSSTTLADTLADWLSPVANPPGPAPSTGAATAVEVADDRPPADDSAAAPDGPAPVMSVPPASDFGFAPAPNPSLSPSPGPVDAAVPIAPGPDHTQPQDPAYQDSLPQPPPPLAPPVELEPEPEPLEDFPMSVIELDWLPPTPDRRSGSTFDDDPHLYSVPLDPTPDEEAEAVGGDAQKHTAQEYTEQEDPEEEFDAGRFTVTADLHEVFERPHPFDEDERPTPPMPPPTARLEPPRPEREPVLISQNGASASPNGSHAGQAAGAAPPMPGPEQRLIAGSDPTNLAGPDQPAPESESQSQSDSQSEPDGGQSEATDSDDHDGPDS